MPAGPRAQTVKGAQSDPNYVSRLLARSECLPGGGKNYSYATDGQINKQTDGGETPDRRFTTCALRTRGQRRFLSSDEGDGAGGGGEAVVAR